MADETRSEKYATFLNNLEQWIEAKITQDGMNEEQLIERIKESYKRSLQANVKHHNELANILEAEGEKQSAKRHALLANVYKALME